MRTLSQSLLSRLASGTLLVAMACSAAAQGYPSKPVTILTPLPPGSTVDVLARAFSQQLSTRLKVPVILYVKHRANDHFTVLRGIDADTVWLADPSLGNRTYSQAQFLRMWETRTGNVDGLAGKFLAVLPVNSPSPGESDFFSRTPIRQSKGAVSDLVHQSWRP